MLRCCNAEDGLIGSGSLERFASLRRCVEDLPLCCREADAVHARLQGHGVAGVLERLPDALVYESHPYCPPREVELPGIFSPNASQSSRTRPFLNR